MQTGLIRLIIKVGETGVIFLSCEVTLPLGIRAPQNYRSVDEMCRLPPAIAFSRAVLTPTLDSSQLITLQRHNRKLN